MEVHHHPHIEKKKFKEYFLEFLMVFLAVTLGFFAENLRESIKDKRQTHEYIQSMVNDLQSDTAMYNSAIAFNMLHCRTIDTVITSLAQNKGNSSLYYMARQLTMGSSVIYPTTKTFEQMKSSGALRLMNRQFVADSIASYYQWEKRFDYWSDFQKQRLNEVIAINDKVFDAAVFFSVLKNIENKNNLATSIPENDLALITTDRSSINSVMMRYQYYYGFLHLMNERSMSASQQATRLIGLLKKQYSLK